MYDRVIVQDVIKSIAQSQQIDNTAKHQFKGKMMYRPIVEEKLTLL